MNVEEYHWTYTIISTFLFLADLTIRIGLSVRVVMRKRSYGVSLAWLVVILLIPFIGAAIYLFLGENRIPEKRVERSRNLLEHYQHWLRSLRERAPVDWNLLNPECRPINLQAYNLIGLPAFNGNTLELLEKSEDIMNSMIKDINNARSTCHLQFYIWQDGGATDRVVNALLQARTRGVVCRILVDAIGSREFIKGRNAQKLRENGIKVLASLPSGIIKALFARIDIRNHRKIVVIDGQIAYTGSQNMVDPLFFKQGEGFGQWVDLMVRVRGPVVESLAGTFINDWFLETEIDGVTRRSLHEDIERVRKIADIRTSPQCGDIAIQVVPSGPGFVPDAIHNLLLTTIYAAREELILTTPYFVPDNAILTALKSAANRGVDVRIIVPRNNDSKLVQLASQAHYEELEKVGISILLFEGGLLHSKTITVDRDFSLLGSVNLDMRSFWLNFEATLFIYNKEFTVKLRGIQARYEAQSQPLDLEALSSRSVFTRFIENSALLIGPLL